MMEKVLVLGGPWHGWAGELPAGDMDKHDCYRRITKGVYEYTGPDDTICISTFPSINRSYQQR